MIVILCKDDSEVLDEWLIPLDTDEETITASHQIRQLIEEVWVCEDMPEDSE